MATRYLELPPDEIDPTPGLVMAESNDTAVAYMISNYGAFEIDKERAIEIFAINHMADGYTYKEARAMAIEDIEEFERQ